MKLHLHMHVGCGVENCSSWTWCYTIVMYVHELEMGRKQRLVLAGSAEDPDCSKCNDDANKLCDCK